MKLDEKGRMVCEACGNLIKHPDAPAMVDQYAAMKRKGDDTLYFCKQCALERLFFPNIPPGELAAALKASLPPAPPCENCGHPRASMKRLVDTPVPFPGEEHECFQNSGRYPDATRTVASVKHYFGKKNAPRVIDKIKALLREYNGTSFSGVHDKLELADGVLDAIGQLLEGA